MNRTGDGAGQLVRAVTETRLRRGRDKRSWVALARGNSIWSRTHEP
jgi:hypothetical protein